MATNPASFYDPNGAYAQGLALAQQQQAQQPPVNALAPTPPAPSPAMPQAPAAPVNALASGVQVAPQQATINALAMPTGQPTQAMVDAAIHAQQHGHATFGSVLGGIGDFLAAFGGKTPVYSAGHQARLAQNSFADWQANPNDPQAQANYLAAAPADAFANTQALHANQLLSMQKMAEIQKAQRDNAMAAVSNAASILKGVRDAHGNVGAAYDQLRATGQLDAVGMHPGEHDYYRDLIVNTPGALDQLAAAPTTAAVDGGANSPKTLIDTKTGRTIATGIAGVVPMTPGQQPYSTAGTAAPPSSDGTAPSAAPSDVSASPNAPRGIRNNNDGNLKDGPFAQAQPGYAGKDANGFAIFNSPGAGHVAQERLLMTKRYFGGGNDTVRGIVSAYLGNGPENSAESKANYIKSVASQMSVDPDAHLSKQVVRPLAAAMRNFENGMYGSSTPVTTPGSIQRGATAPVANGVEGPHWLEGNSTGQLSQPAMDQATDYWIATNNFPPNDGRSGFSNQQIMENAAKRGYSGAMVNAIRAGRSSDQTALDSLSKAEPLVNAAENGALGNAKLALDLSRSVPRNHWPTVNEIMNGIARHTGDPDITALDTGLMTFSNQYGAVVGGGQATDNARHEAATMISSAQTPQQLEHNIGILIKEMENRSQGYAAKKAEIMGRMGALPTAVHTPADLAKLPKGTRYVRPDGQMGTRK